MTKEEAVRNLINTAMSEVGYLEKKSNKDLDVKAANAGKGNYTKYARDLVNLIGSPYAQGAAWCDMFVDWCFIQTFGKDNTKKMLGGWSAYTPTSANFYKNSGRFVKSPKIGDQIFFKNSERINHTGIVASVTNEQVFTIEGNSSNAVVQKGYLLTDKSIAGYGRPDWSVVSTEAIAIDCAKIGSVDITDTLNPNKFDVRKYRAAYKDLEEAFGDHWQMYYYHYQVFGKKEIAAGQRPPFM